MSVLHIVFPELPPTSNHIFIRGTMLTQKAREYAERFAMHMRHHLAEISLIDPSLLYAVHLRFYFHLLVNPTYGDLSRPPSKRAKSRYKKIDLDNRVKLLTDCLRDAVQVDDSQTFAASQEKHQCQPGEAERVELYLHPVSPKDFGL